MTYDEDEIQWEYMKGVITGALMGLTCAFLVWVYL